MGCFAFAAARSLSRAFTVKCSSDDLSAGDAEPNGTENKTEPHKKQREQHIITGDGGKAAATTTTTPKNARHTEMMEKWLNWHWLRAISYFIHDAKHPMAQTIDPAKPGETKSICGRCIVWPRFCAIGPDSMRRGCTYWIFLILL